MPRRHPSHLLARANGIDGHPLVCWAINEKASDIAAEVSPAAQPLPTRRTARIVPILVLRAEDEVLISGRGEGEGHVEQQARAHLQVAQNEARRLLTHRSKVGDLTPGTVFPTTTSNWYCSQFGVGGCPVSIGQRLRALLCACCAYHRFMVQFKDCYQPVARNSWMRRWRAACGVRTVSYTHLTLPTNREV